MSSVFLLSYILVLRSVDARARACVCQRGGMARLGLLCMLRGEPDATQQYAEFGAFLVSCISHRRLRGMALV